MPTYDYQCRQCGRTYEVIHSMLADGPTTCEQCGGPLRRVLHPTGIIFKGSGFYRTDSRAAGDGDRRSPTSATETSAKGSDAKASGADGSAGSQKSTVTGADGASSASKE